MSATDWKISPRAAKLHADAMVWDQCLSWCDFGRLDLKRASLAREQAAGVDFVSLTVATDFEDVSQVIHALGRDRQYVLANSDRFQLCETAADVLAAKSTGKLGVNFNFQGTNAFNRSIELVEIYYKLGVRYALMAYNQKNAVGDGCHERTNGGLSRYGIALVREMNRVGMVVDCSHTGHRTSLDVFECAEGPVIFSHSNPLALWDHPRNIADDQIDACARSGGVIGINGIGVFMAENDASTELLINQIDYLVQRVGPAHVGIGLDWVYDLESLIPWVQQQAAEAYPDDGYKKTEMKIGRPEQLPEITDGLLDRGYSEKDIRDILGLNWLRIAQQVWK